jgi:endo-1,3-1,4-beta-glycanase ExoK
MKRPLHKTHNVRGWMIFFFTLTFLLIASRSQPPVTAQKTPTGFVYELAEGETVTGTVRITNRCKAAHNFRIREDIKYLSFQESTESIQIAPGAPKPLDVKLDATGVKPKVYEDKLVVECLNCKKEKGCTQDRDIIPVQLTVKANQIVRPRPSGSIMGRVVDPRNNPIRGAEVRTPGQPVVLTNGKGEFDIRGLAATERLAVSFSARGFMDTTRIYRVGESSRGINTVVIWPRAEQVSLDATRGGKLTFPGGTVSFPPRALVDERGRSLQGEVKVSFSTLDVSDRRQIRSAPGDFTARMRNKRIRQLETFGVFEVFVEDSEGRRVDLAKGRKAAVELLIPPAVRRTARKQVGLFSFDKSDGLWLEEGTLQIVPGGDFYQAAVSSTLVSWNADDTINTTCIKLKILNEDSQPGQPNQTAPQWTRVEAEGVSYSGTSPPGYTDSLGYVCLSVRSCSTVRVKAFHPTDSDVNSCPVTIMTPCQVASASDCANPSLCPLQPQQIILPNGTLYHGLNADDPANWEVRTGTNYDSINSNFYDVWFSGSNHIVWGGGIMRLLLDATPPPGPPTNTTPVTYSSGEYRTKTATSGYGTYEVCMKPARGPGLMSSFFTYTGQFEMPSTQHNEIDIEFRGQDTTKLWTNFYCDDTDPGHESTVTLGFDAADDFHRYKFVWAPSEVKWYVDGQYVPTPNSGSNPCASPTVPGKIMVNLWSGNLNSNSWLGTFSPSQIPVYAEYDWIRYKP